MGEAENLRVRLLDIKPRGDICGLIRELYNDKNISMAHVDVTGTAKKHKHNKMLEIYYV